MTTALRRRLDALRALAERPVTEGERSAAEAAIGRLLARLGEPSATRRRGGAHGHQEATGAACRASAADGRHHRLR